MFSFYQSQALWSDTHKAWRYDFTARMESLSLQIPIFVEDDIAESRRDGVAKDRFTALIGRLYADVQSC